MSGTTHTYNTMDEMFAEFEEERRKHPWKARYRDTRNGIRHARIWNIRREIKWFIQRGKRGYADNDLWDLDHYLTKVMLATFKDYRRDVHGWPGDEIISWDDYLTGIDSVVAGFEAARKILEDEYDFKDIKTYRALEAEFKTGLDFFKEHYFTFWL